MIEMSREEAIGRIQDHIHIHSKKEPFTPYLDKAFYMAIEALKERPQGKWEYLKEHITEMRDADGKLNQKQTCQFILNLMGVIEKEGDRNERQNRL